MDALKLSPSTLNREFCVLMNKKRRYDCRNHIKVIQRIAPDRLYVCGTNAQKPWDWIINVSRQQRMESANTFEIDFLMTVLSQFVESFA